MGTVTGCLKRVVAFVAPGINGSALPMRPYLLSTLASLVGALAAADGHYRFDVLGISSNSSPSCLSCGRP